MTTYRTLALALALLLPALTGRAQSALPGTYRSRLELSSGMCCSASCGAVSTTVDVTLTLAADHAAALHWVRAGCSVTVSGEGPTHMPIDPGPPAVVCGMGGPGATLRVLDGETTQHGTWRQDGEAALVTLASDTTLRCAPTTVDGHALLACTMDARGIDATGLMLAGQLYLDRRPGLVARLDGHDVLTFDRRR